MNGTPKLNPRIISGYLMAQRADRSNYGLMMPRDENEARGVAAYFGLTAAQVTQALTRLGVTAGTLKTLAAERREQINA